MMPLTFATIGEENTIIKVSGNGETRRFLENLGFIAGATITVMSAIGGNVIVDIKGSRIAINEDMARHIMI
ncbi:MAG: ferrous iron transport protein A [Erysipelotrichaceae bacterium]|nr:ferrous iron transport protein A [Erysipelotrichaceae bacterium]MCD8027804.1 ferrous iron transport protein A [Erysipelotrichaceae bacterium]